MLSSRCVCSRLPGAPHAHGLGKLLKYVGEQNVLWDTDSIWYDSPQDRIQAFRTFQSAEPLRERHGYPEIHQMRSNYALQPILQEG